MAVQVPGMADGGQEGSASNETEETRPLIIHTWSIWMPSLSGSSPRCVVFRADGLRPAAKNPAKVGDKEWSHRR